MARIIVDHLATLLRGRRVSELHELYEEMSDAQLTYGQSGASAAAVSAVDLALWDLYAQLCTRPLARVLTATGEPRSAVPCYITMHPQDERNMDGFYGIKIPARFGPYDGPGAAERVVQDIIRVKRNATPHTLIMIDAACGWTLDFTLDVLNRLGEGVLNWLEDPLTPWRREDYANLADVIAQTRGLSLCLGNYDFSPRSGHRTIADGFVNVYQPDLTWVGGLTAALQLAKDATSRGLVIAPHYGAMHPWTVHFMASQPNIGPAEYIPPTNCSSRSDFPDLPVPDSGMQIVPRSPGASARVSEDTFQADHDGDVISHLLQ